MASPTQRTLERCRKLGWRASVVEQTVPHTFIKRDLWGFADVIAMDGTPGSLLIQVTSGSNASARVSKICEECQEAAMDWLYAGNRIQVWSWSQRIHRNKDGSKSKVKRWTLRRVRVFANYNVEEGVTLKSEVIE